MAKEMGIGLGTMKSLIEVYSFMLENGDTNIQHWSYYEEYLKSRKIGKRRTEHRNFDEVFVKQVKSGDIPKGIDVREKVVKIAEAGGKTLKSFLDENKSLDECYEIALSRGMGNTLYKRLNRFRVEIGDPDTKKELKKMPKPQLDKCRFELRKIKTSVDHLLVDEAIGGE
jgi:hypothetical protein